MAKQKKPRDLKGGKARATKLTSEQRREQARKAAQARWHKNNRPGQPGEYREAVGHGLNATEMVMERKTVYGLALIGVAVAAISLLLLGYACPRYNQRAAQMDAIERATVNAVEAAKFLPPGAAVDYLERNYSTLERGRVVHDQLQGERKDYGVLSLLALAGVVGGLAFTIQALRRRL